jgi:hypothetical protein
MVGPTASQPATGCLAPVEARSMTPWTSPVWDRTIRTMKVKTVGCSVGMGIFRDADFINPGRKIALNHREKGVKNDV